MQLPRRAWRRMAAAAGILAGLAVVACENRLSAPEALLSIGTRLGDGQPAVLVNPTARGAGTAATIQEGIDRVAPGGTVLVVPGTYREALVIDKGLTLRSVGGRSGEVTIAPPAGTQRVIQVATTEPVVLRGLDVLVPGQIGISGDGAVVELTVEQSSVTAVDPPLGISALVFVPNHAATGARARLVLRDSRLDGSIDDQPFPPPPFPQLFAVHVGGDVDALIERNAIRRTGAACIFILPRADLGGELNADIVDNELDECHPFGRVGSILVGPAAGNFPSATRPLTATGTVNIVGNTIRNSSRSCLTSGAIVYEVYSGRIEHNRIVDVVQECAEPTPRNRPAAIWIGATRPDGSGAFFPPVTPIVRFNDIAGNAHGGLRIAPNQTIPIDATCNWWGAADGPSGLGAGSGDAIVVEPGGAAPLFAPHASAPVAGRGTGCPIPREGS